MTARQQPFWRLLIALCAAELVCSLATNMIAVTLAELYRIFGDPLRVGWILTAFTLTAAASAAIAGRLGDIYGRRRVLLVLLVVAGLGCLLSAASPDLNVIVAGRALQGVSMAILPLCYGLVKEHAPPGKVATGVGILGGVYSFGIALGLILGGLIVDYGDWQQIFLVIATVAVAGFLLVLALVPAGAAKPAARRIDVMGGVLFVPAIGALLISLDQLKRLGFASPMPWLWAVAGLAIVAIWVRRELKLEDPLIDVRQLKAPTIAAANACTLLVCVGPMQYALVLLPLLIQPTWTGVGLGLTATMTALLKIPGNIVSGSAAVYAGRLGERFGGRQLVLWACLIAAAGCASLAFAHASVWIIAGVMIFLLTTPLTLVFASLPALVLAATPDDRSSEATGMLQVTRSLGLAIGTQVVATILASDIVRGADGSGFPSESAYVLALAYFGVTAVAAGLSILLAPSRKALPQHEHAARAGERAPSLP